MKASRRASKRKKGVPFLKAMYAQIVQKPNFVAYSENRSDKLKAELIPPQAALLRVVAAKIHNLSIAKVESEQALLGIYEDHYGSERAWTFDMAAAQVWAVRMTKRMQCLCRHVQQARSKGNTNP